MALRTLLRQKAVQEEAVVVVQHPVEQAVARYEASRDALRKFMQDNGKVFDSLDRYVGEYNESIDAAADIMRNTKDLRGVYTGEFKLGKPGEAVTYDIAKLPKHVLDIPGVLTVDSKVIKELIDERVITAAVVHDAVVAKPRAGKLTGPKPVELQVGSKK